MTGKFIQASSGPELHWAETMHLPHLLNETLWAKLIPHAVGKVTPSASSPDSCT